MEKLYDIISYMYNISVIELKQIIENSLYKNEKIEEFRIRIGQQIILKTNTQHIELKINNKNKVEMSDIKNIVYKLIGYSFYSLEEELTQGYFTIEGGHRVGFCGKFVLESGQVKTVTHISSLNIRIARDVKGCSKKWLPYIFENQELCHIFIISPPSCGKTTFLRDLIRQLSYGSYNRKYTIGVVDERGEIAGMKNGVPQMDLGGYVDVQENCSKKEGMNFLLRCMSPEVIAVDELGKDEDFQAIEELIHSGVNILATIHGYDYNRFLQKDKLKKIEKEVTKGRFIFLCKSDCGTGIVKKICNIRGEVLYGG